MERLDKLVASRMCISRSDAKALIRRGAVTVNGGVEKSPDVKCGEGDSVQVQGQEILTSDHIYIMMNKPEGVVSATRDNRSKTVLDLVPDELRRKGLFPAGRLDKDTQGFLLLTDDGDFAHRILSPKRHVPKTYHATLNKAVDMDKITALFSRSMDLGDGDVTSPAQVRLLLQGEAPQVEVTIYEGAYHQVKRMFAKCGASVIGLRRVKIGNLQLDSALAPGECKLLTPQEVKEIEEAI